jgi:hypothetical protein
MLLKKSYIEDENKLTFQPKIPKSSQSIVTRHRASAQEHGV